MTASIDPANSSDGVRRTPRPGPSRRRGIPVVALVLVLALIGLVLLVNRRGPAASYVPPPTGRLAFAHYFTPFPLGNDQPAETDQYARQFLPPGGEGGKHAAYGGFLRDRPVPRPPSGGDQQLTDLETEVRQAKAGGLDGFTVDLLSNRPSNYNYVRVQALLEAAHEVDPAFRILLMPDMASLRRIDQDAMATMIGDLAAAPSAYRLPDGRVVISPFKAEGRPPSWWSGVFTRLKDRYGISVAFVPTFLDWRGNLDRFRSISYGYSAWGDRSPLANADIVVAAREAHIRGKLWMAPISVQDERPNQGVYDEAENTTNLRTTWQAAINGGADWVQLTTWNDYSENTSFAPSVHHGWTFLDLSFLYLTRWKTGAMPPVRSDVLYLTHRTQFTSAQPSYPQTKLMHLRDNSSPSRDEVEVVSVLQAPSTLSITIGGAVQTFDAPAGLSVHTVPLALGAVSAVAERGDAPVATATSPFPVVATPVVQDLQYVGVSSDPRPPLPE
jgi:hypothetical protein